MFFMNVYITNMRKHKPVEMPHDIDPHVSVNEECVEFRIVSLLIGMTREGEWQAVGVGRFPAKVKQSIIVIKCRQFVLFLPGNSIYN